MNIIIIFIPLELVHNVDLLAGFAQEAVLRINTNLSLETSHQENYTHSLTESNTSLSHLNTLESQFSRVFDWIEKVIAKKPSHFTAFDNDFHCLIEWTRGSEHDVLLDLFDQVFVALLSPFFKQAMRDWEPLKEPLRGNLELISRIRLDSTVDWVFETRIL